MVLYKKKRNRLRVIRTTRRWRRPGTLVSTVRMFRRFFAQFWAIHRLRLSAARKKSSLLRTTSQKGGNQFIYPLLASEPSASWAATCPYFLPSSSDVNFRSCTIISSFSKDWTSSYRSKKLPTVSVSSRYFTVGSI